MLAEFIEITTSVAEHRDAAEIAAELVRRRLAASAQVFGPVETTTRWNERLETVKEFVVLIRTRGDYFGMVEEAILELHPYDHPEISASAIDAMNAGYRDWLLEQFSSPPVLAATTIDPAETTGESEDVSE